MGIELHSEYKTDADKPHAVTMWELRAANAETHEAALAQLTYQQLVETRKLRMAATGILAVLLLSFVAGLVWFLITVSA